MPGSLSQQDSMHSRRCLTPQPFLKWAGGKRALLPEILPLIPVGIPAYHEPFLGAGAVLFAQPRGIPRFANDYNAELVAVYEAIRDDVDGLLEELRTHRHSKKEFLAVRAWDRTPDFLNRSPAARAARFIYLNKCGFNGLYRVNRQGHFNVPFGQQKNPDFVSEENLRAVSDFLRERDEQGSLRVSLTSGDYRAALRTVERGHFVYCDPPYDPISSTSAFTAYHEDGFGQQDQTSLRDEVLRLTEVGAQVLLSNSDTPLIRSLYKDRRIFTVRQVQVRRAIAARGASRGAIAEVLVDNFKAVRTPR